MKKLLNLRIDESLNKTLIFSGILILFLFIGSLIAAADAGISERSKLLDIQKSAISQTGSSSKLESAPLNPKFVKYQKDKILTQAVSTSNVQKTGLIPSPVDLSHLSPIPTVKASYSSYYDLRELNRVTSVKDQYPLGTCWIFATYGSLESYLMPEENWNFSENNMKNLLSSEYPQGFDAVNPENQGGNCIMSTAYLARWSGPVSESDDPYSFYNWTSPENLTLKKHVQNVTIIPDRQGPLDNDNIKWAIQNFGAMDTQMHIYETESELYSYYNPSEYCYYCDNKNLGANHDVVIVGWNDSFDRNKFNTTPPGDGAFIVKNSWGTGFGENGYFYVSYYDSLIGTCNSIFKAENPNNYKNIYQYDPLGWINRYALNPDPPSHNAWCANIFTAKSDEILKAVSFYTTDSNCSYEVYVSTNTQTEKVFIQKDTIPEPGYHTIPLNIGVPLRGDQEFAVILKLVTPNSNYPLALEYPIPGYSSSATAHPDESYVSSDGNTWIDLTTIPNYENSNVCIKAFTIPKSWLPTSNFSATPSRGNEPLDITFNDTSTGSPTLWHWNFGDGNTSSEQNPKHTYLKVGTYTVNLTVSNGNGTDSKTATITVLHPVYAYATNFDDNTISIIDTFTNNFTATVPVGSHPFGVAVTPDGSKVYVTNQLSNDVSVIDRATRTVITTINVGKEPWGIAVSPDGKRVYVANNESNNVSIIDSSSNLVIASVDVGREPRGVAVSPNGTKVFVANANEVSVIDTATNTVTATVADGEDPFGIAVSPDGSKLYVTNYGTTTNFIIRSPGNTVSIIDTATNTATATVTVGSSPKGVSVSPDGTKVYVANSDSNIVSVINTSTNNVIAIVYVGISPVGIAITQDGSKVYVTNQGSNNVSIIDTTTNAVTATVNVGNGPVAFGQFIEQPVPPIANFKSNVSEGYAPLSIQFTDLSKNAVECCWDFGDGFNSIEQSPVHVYSTAGNYTVNLTVSNANGKSSKTATINVINESISDGDSSSSKNQGSGGGTIDSPELKNNIESKESSKEFVFYGNSVKFDFPMNVTPIVYIAFDAKVSPGKTTTVVETLNKKSILVPELPFGEVYKSLNIWAGNNGFIIPQYIENAVICFKVEKSWIQDKSINQSSITLNRYSDKKWDQLPTNFSGEDEKYLYFMAQTPGFSPFAITGTTTSNGSVQLSKEKTHPIVNDTRNNTNSVGTEPNAEPSLETEQISNTSGSESTEIPGFATVFGMICVNIAMLAILLYFFRK